MKRETRLKNKEMLVVGRRILVGIEEKKRVREGAVSNDRGNGKKEVASESAQGKKALAGESLLSEEG